MAGNKMRRIEGKNALENIDPPQVRLRQIKEFGRLLLADNHLMGLVMDSRISPEADTEKMGQQIAKDIEKLKMISRVNGSASLIGIRKLREFIEKNDPIEADLPCAQLMLIACDHELHGHEAVVESARILMNNTEVSSSSLFALGFGYDEIEKISKMNKDEINRNIESLLREKSLIR